MKTVKSKTGVILGAIAFLAISLFFPQCKKEDTVTPLSGTPVNGSALIDSGWTFDKAHSNVGWSTRYYDYSDAMLTGRFDTFGLGVFSDNKPKFFFNQSNLAASSLEAWVRVSSTNTGEPGRDGLGKCGPSYLGLVYLDSSKTMINRASDTAWFKSTSFEKSGSGYIVKGNFTFNRYRAPSGFPDGTPITKPVTMYLDYQGMKDFDTNNDGTNDRYRAGFTGTFTFKRSDHFDNAMTVAYYPVPTYNDSINNITAANNKTYGNYSRSVDDEMNVTINLQMRKNH